MFIITLILTYPWQWQLLSHWSWPRTLPWMNHSLLSIWFWPLTLPLEWILTLVKTIIPTYPALELEPWCWTTLRQRWKKYLYPKPDHDPDLNPDFDLDLNFTLTWVFIQTQSLITDTLIPSWPWSWPRPWSWNWISHWHWPSFLWWMFILSLITFIWPIISHWTLTLNLIFD